MEKLSVIIPVYNELATIAEIIRRVEEAKIPVVKEIILVDDGSTDGSREYLRQLSGRHTVVLHEKNRGKGAAVRSGLSGPPAAGSSSKTRISNMIRPITAGCCARSRRAGPTLFTVRATCSPTRAPAGATITAGD